MVVVTLKCISCSGEQYVKQWRSSRRCFVWTSRGQGFKSKFLAVLSAASAVLKSHLLGSSSVRGRNEGLITIAAKWGWIYGVKAWTSENSAPKDPRADLIRTSLGIKSAAAASCFAMNMEENFIFWGIQCVADRLFWAFSLNYHGSIVAMFLKSAGSWGQ